MDQAVSMGLIVNELVTNAIKHAFPDNRGGNIRVQFEAHEDQLHLFVADDGVGFDDCIESDPGIGQDLVRGLSRQLGGELEVKSGKSGSTFRLCIPYARPGLPIPSPERRPGCGVRPAAKFEPTLEAGKHRKSITPTH
jgi:two-component sensor histidine kinase